jgi:hypothetical protein
MTAPKGLEPEGVGEAAQQLLAPVMVDDGLAHDRAEPGHPVGELLGDAATMQRQIGASRPSSHSRQNPFAVIPQSTRWVGFRGWDERVAPVAKRIELPVAAERGRQQSIHLRNRGKVVAGAQMTHRRHQMNWPEGRCGRDAERQPR